MGDKITVLLVVTGHHKTGTTGEKKTSLDLESQQKQIQSYFCYMLVTKTGKHLDKPTRSPATGAPWFSGAPLQGEARVPAPTLTRLCQEDPQFFWVRRPEEEHVWGVNTEGEPPHRRLFQDDSGSLRFHCAHDLLTHYYRDKM